jgi:hypothetical protein
VIVPEPPEPFAQNVRRAIKIAPAYATMAELKKKAAEYNQRAKQDAEPLGRRPFRRRFDLPDSNPAYQ